VLEEALGELLCRRRAKADRVGDALSDGNAVVRALRRQIQKIACAYQPFMLAAETFEYPERRVCELQIALPAHAPAPLAAALHQEHVVTIEVRADAAAGRGVAHHHVVDSRVRYESKLAHKACCP
jgi:hypothetical protein